MACIMAGTDGCAAQLADSDLAFFERLLPSRVLTSTEDVKPFAQGLPPQLLLRYQLLV